MTIPCHSCCAVTVARSSAPDCLTYVPHLFSLAFTADVHWQTYMSMSGLCNKLVGQRAPWRGSIRLVWFTTQNRVWEKLGAGGAGCREMKNSLPGIDRGVRHSLSWVGFRKMGLGRVGKRRRRAVEKRLRLRGDRKRGKGWCAAADGMGCNPT